MRKMTESGLRWIVCGALLMGLSGGVVADDLESLRLPVFTNRDGYSLIVTEYEARTNAELLDEDEVEHEIALGGMMIGPKSKDVLCFRTHLGATSAENKDRDELLLPGRKRKQNKYSAVVPQPDFPGRRRDPLQLAAVELEDLNLSEPGYRVEKLLLAGEVVLIEKREVEDLPAVVADQFVNIGHDTRVRINAMEVNNKGIMTIKMDLRREGGDDAPVIESMHALNSKGEIIGGGRWVNELELFSEKYEVELELILKRERSVAGLQITLATKYKVEPVTIQVEKLFQK